MFLVKPSPKQTRNLATIHNFGFYTSSVKSAICHTAWTGKTLTLLGLWSVEGDSIAPLYSRVLDQIRSCCDQQACYFYFYAPQDLRLDLARFATEKQLSSRVKIQVPVCEIREALTILVGTETTDQIAIAEGVDIERLERLAPEYTDLPLQKNSEMMALTFAISEPLKARSIEDSKKMLRR